MCVAGKIHIPLLDGSNMTSSLHTPLCDLLGIRYPILCAPMGWLTGPELVAAVCNAGGLGILGAGALPPEALRARIRRVRELTSEPFGVNLILTRPSEERARVCFEERVPLLSLFWGDPRPYTTRAGELGIKTCIQVGSVAAAQEAARAGVDFVIAQGMEAGGHTHGQLTTMTLVPQVVDAVGDMPVAAAGGIADARGLVAALALGAQGAVLGTRFLAADEAQAHPRYKELVVAASSEDTVRTTLFGGGWPHAPHRVLHTAFVREWLPQEARGSEGRLDEPILGQSLLGTEALAIRRFMMFPPNTDTSGEIESMALYAGQSAGMLDSIEPAGEIVTRLVAQAVELLRSRLLPLAR
jgi:NAD(P)H-dependent flavin oxidoreductase YrpB (nitropropane dioxygenase family)